MSKSTLSCSGLLGLYAAVKALLRPFPMYIRGYHAEDRKLYDPYFGY